MLAPRHPPSRAIATTCEPRSVDCVAIIPARAGSKRIPGKNIRPLHGRPTLGWPIQACLESRLFRRILVSTDAPEVAAVARTCGAEAPFLRPAEISDDHTPTAPVMLHALDWLQAQGETPQAFCCIYATAVQLQANDLQAGYDLLCQGAPGVVAVTTYDFPIYRAMRVTHEGSLAMVWPEYELTRSNDLPETVHDAGQFYWRQTADFRADPRMYAQNSRPIHLPRWRAPELDTPEDWELVERLMR